MNKIEKGFLYIAFGDAFTKEALMSIKSLKRYNNEPVALFTDSDKTDEFEGLVDIYGKIEPKHIRAKVEELWHTTIRQQQIHSSQCGGNIFISILEKQTVGIK